MKFWEAMKYVEQGKTVTPSDCEYPINKEILTQDALDTGWATYWDDEWEIYEESEITYSWMEVVQGLKQGKKYRRKGWSSSIYITSKDEGVYVVNGSGYRWIADYEATDWIEVKE